MCQQFFSEYQFKDLYGTELNKTNGLNIIEN